MDKRSLILDARGILEGGFYGNRALKLAEEGKINDAVCCVNMSWIGNGNPETLALLDKLREADNYSPS